MKPVTALSLLLFVSAAMAQNQVQLADPATCNEASKAAPLEITDGPVRVSPGTDSSCLAVVEKGGTLRIWKYGRRYQRLAAANTWKVIVQKGDGDQNSYVLPHNSVIGIVLEHKNAKGEWKNYTGSSKNPISKTQPSILLTVRKATGKAAGLKKEHLTWDIFTVDALDLDHSRKDAAGKFPLPEGSSELRINEVWVWQGLNPIAKKLNVSTGKASVKFQAE